MLSFRAQGRPPTLLSTASRLDGHRRLASLGDANPIGILTDRVGTSLRGDVFRREAANSILMRVRKHQARVFPESSSASFGEQRRSTLPVRERSNDDVPRKPANNIRGTTSFNNDVFERKLAEALGPMELKILFQNTTKNPTCVFRHL